MVVAPPPEKSIIMLTIFADVVVVEFKNEYLPFIIQSPAVGIVKIPVVASKFELLMFDPE